jgi:hypothetical protein
MIQKNYTPIDDLIKKWQQKAAVSLPSKEAEPIPKKEIEFKEVKEKEVEEEVRPHLIKREETIKLPSDIQKLGLKPIPTADFPQYQNIKLPLSDDKIVVGLHAPISSSLRWLATLALYLLQKAHLSLKVIHGRVVRVLRR